MANRRNLKKYVNYVAGELYKECLIKELYIPNTDKEKAAKIMDEILDMQNEFISRISHTEPGNTKGFYRKFHEDFRNKVNEILEALY